MKLQEAAIYRKAALAGLVQTILQLLAEQQVQAAAVVAVKVFLAHLLAAAVSAATTVAVAAVRAPSVRNMPAAATAARAS